MAITINGTGTITGISAGGLPDGSITTDDIASGAVTTAKLTGGPAFSAGGTTQALSANVTTKVVLATENFDTASCYDTSTSRFTPNVAGYYFISATAQYVDATTGGWFILKLNQSGTQLELSVYNNLDQYMRQNIQYLYYFNGTTDYVEFYAVQTSTVTRNIASTHFQGFLVRPA